MGLSAFPRGPGFPGWEELEEPGGQEGSRAVSDPRGAASGILGMGNKVTTPGLPEVWLRTSSQPASQVDSSRRATTGAGTLGEAKGRQWRWSCPTVTKPPSPFPLCSGVPSTDELPLGIPLILALQQSEGSIPTQTDFP